MDRTKLKAVKADIHDQVLDNNLMISVDGILRKMGILREEKQYLISRGKKKHRNAIKILTKRINELDKKRRYMRSEGSGIRGDPIPTEEVKKEENYSFSGHKPRKKKGSGNKRRKINSAINGKLNKRKQKRGW